MANPVKIILTSKKKLVSKYGTNFSKVEKHFTDLVEADRKRDLDTRIIYIDHAASARQAGIATVTAITRQSCKRAVDDIYKKIAPAYLVIFGAPDIIPFQELTNSVPYDPLGDDDRMVPSDLPYACDAPYGPQINAFTGPGRVIGRIPDINGKADMKYLDTVFQSIINFKPLKEAKYLPYFSVTADVWKASTKQGLDNIFGNSTKLKISPPAAISYKASTLKPLMHFYNCHGAPADAKFYGEKDVAEEMPVAMESTDLKNKISFGTVVAAECCYGAELYNPANEGNRKLPMANTYFANEAIAFVGSSNIAYGLAEGQSSADLVAEYFLKQVLAGASTGRAFLEARQQFLSSSSPLDPYEMKTIAQFYLLGDPSLQPVAKEADEVGRESVVNRRLNLTSKAVNLAGSVDVCKRVMVPDRKKQKIKPGEVFEVFKTAGFSGKEKEVIFDVSTKSRSVGTLAKKLTGSNEILFRTFTKQKKAGSHVNGFEVLVLKESGENLLSWKVYHRK